MRLQGTHATMRLPLLLDSPYWLHAGAYLHNVFESRPNECLDPLKEGREERHLPCPHDVALLVVDLQEQQAANGVPRLNEEMLQVLHTVKDCLAKDVLKNVLASKKLDNELVFAPNSVHEECGDGSKDSFIVQTAASLQNHGGHEERGDACKGWETLQIVARLLEHECPREVW